VREILKPKVPVLDFLVVIRIKYLDSNPQETMMIGKVASTILESRSFRLSIFLKVDSHVFEHAKP